MKNIAINVEVNLEDLVENLHPEDALELISAIDDSQMNWDFTHEVAMKFVKQIVDLDNQLGNFEYTEELRKLLGEKK